MAIIESYLWQIVAEIEPTASQKEGAKRSHWHLRSLLNSGQMANRIQDSYLSGSYARDTAIRPLEDVDIIFIVDPKPWLDGLLRIYDRSLPTPSKILDSFARAIRYRYPVSTVSGQRRSVRLQLEHLDIDVVPAVYASDSDLRVIKIPDSDTDGWVLSAPRIHEQKSTEVNKLRGGRIKPLIKLLKFWNSNLPSTANFKSFAIETMALRIFQTIECPTLQEGLLTFFDFFAYVRGQPTQVRWSNTCGMDFSWLGCRIPDIAGTGGNVAQGTSDDRKIKFIDAAIRSRNKMLEGKQSLYTSVATDRVTEALRY